MSLPLTEKEPLRDESHRVPHPSYRHATPSAPWSWTDLDDEVDPFQLECPLPPIPEPCDHSPGSCNRCWTGYPQSLFPQWTERQIRKAKIYEAIHNTPGNKLCTCYQLDVNMQGVFNNSGKMTAAYGDEDLIWDQMIYEQRPRDTRLRAIFIQDLYGPVLQMLGTKYNIEPFFWSSSFNWIPSQFQDDVRPGIGDRITITLPFPLSIVPPNNYDVDTCQWLGSQMPVIDTRAPFTLNSNNRLLVLDLLSVYLIRNINGSTIISYHPSLKLPTTTAKYLHTRIHLVDKSMYWKSIFQKTQDPTFVLLTFIWHTMYAWDDALENLYEHICALEGHVLSTAEMPPARELHVIGVYHFYYLSLLDQYTKHVTFIRNTPNPAMDALNEEERVLSQELLNKECDNLLNEIKRLQSDLDMQKQRLKNVMGLVFSSINIAMMDATARDSTAMKQISYLTMVFLPASFAASIFGMNVDLINGTGGSITSYLALALPLTMVTAWIIIAFQTEYLFPPGTSLFKRIGWPVFFICMISKKRQRVARNLQPDYSIV